MTDRLTRIRTELDERNLDALLISAPGEEELGAANRRYVSGFTGSTGQVLVTRDRAIFAADFRYVEQAERECAPRGFEVFQALGARREWFPRLIGEAGLGGRRIGISTRDLSYAGFLAMMELLDDLPASGQPELVPAKGIVEGLRRMKDPEELGLIERAIAISDAAFDRLESALRPDMTELEVAEVFAANVRAAGGEDISFPTIVAAGPWSAMPHASPRPEVLGEGRPIVIDMGARFAGYCSDLTRTLALGTPDAKFRAVYSIVFEAQTAAIEGIEAGMRASDAHMLAQGVIDRAGYGERFGHGLGHGVGLDVHEDPYLGTSSEDVLEEGMVFTIEPGIYLPGWGGVRIEDIVVIENGKPRVLSHARKLTPAGV